MQSRKNASNSKFPAIKSRQMIRVAGEYWLPLQRLVDLGGRGGGATYWTKLAHIKRREAIGI